MFELLCLVLDELFGLVTELLEFPLIFLLVLLTLVLVLLRLMDEFALARKFDPLVIEFRDVE